MTIDIEAFKKKLKKEQGLLLSELGSVGRINPDNPDDWEATAGELNVDPAEDEERASEISDFSDRVLVEAKLEERLNEVNTALAAIDKGTYGICRVCKKPIEDARLNASPSAPTCKAHME